MKEPLFNIQVLPPILDALQASEGPTVVRRALAQIDLPPSAIDGSPLYLPYRLQAAFIEAAARAAGDRFLGARVGSLLPYTYLGLYARYVLAGETLDDALRRAARALPYVVSGASVGIAEREEHLLIRFESGIAGVVGARHIHEALPVIIADLVRRFVDPGWHPLWIELDQPCSSRTGELEDIYGAPLRLGADLPALALDRDLLSRAHPSLPPLGPRMTIRDLRLLTARKPPRRFAGLVDNAIELQMRVPDVSIESVAARIGVGVRGLQRRLNSEGTTYQECLDRVRYERAAAYLLETSAPDAAIGGALGYCEVNSFRRAFTRWSGQSPQSYRTSRRSQVAAGQRAPAPQDRTPSPERDSAGAAA